MTKGVLINHKFKLRTICYREKIGNPLKPTITDKIRLVKFIINLPY